MERKCEYADCTQTGKVGYHGEGVLIGGYFHNHCFRLWTRLAKWYSLQPKEEQA